jgi:hypothetical protein
MGAMTRLHRRLFVTVGLLACILVAGGAWLLWPRTMITAENAAKIQPGMTVAEVEEILGGPARNEAPEVARVHRMLQSVSPDLEWTSEQVSVWVRLEGDGHVRACRAIPAPPAQGPIATLRRWLRL